MNSSENFSELLEIKLPEIIKKIAQEYNIQHFIDNPDFLEPRLEKWHQFGLLGHTKKVRQVFLSELDIFLKNFGILEKINKVFDEEIDGIRKKELFEMSILLHDLGKILVFNNEKTDREHEIYSRDLLSGEILGQELSPFGLSEKQLEYIGRCIETHDVIGKKIRDSLKHNNNLTMSFLSNQEVINLCKNLASDYLDIKGEMGIYFLCDSLGKTDLRIDVETDEDIIKKEQEVIKSLQERNLPQELKHGVMQLPVNIKLAEIYLQSIVDFKEIGKKLRKKVIDFGIEKGDAHLGGSFSEIEILIALFYFILKEEDKFILSKGHACHPLYILLKEKGYSPKISGHPDIDLENKISCTTGSLGHGLPIGIGMALARKKLKKSGKIYVLMGDGECQEGTTWESALIASHHKLDNLVVIIDYNKLQALDKIENVLSLGDLGKKFEVFGWHVSEVDGHDVQKINEELKKNIEGKPRIILAHTIKGKGISYMENDPQWHGKRLTLERVQKAYEELK